MVAICPDCAAKISECYRLTPIRAGTSCAFCQWPEATVYEMFSKNPPKPRARARMASAGTTAERDAYLSRRRWA